MPTLEKIAETGMFSVDSDGSFSPSMFSLGEELVAEDFAAEINSGRLSVETAWRDYWSYVEDKELWGLEGLADDDYRAILPPWRKTLFSLAALLKKEKAGELVEVLSKNYFTAKKALQDNHYNPFFWDLYASLRILGLSDIKYIKLKEGIYQEFFDMDFGVFQFTELFDSREFCPFLTELLSSNSSGKDGTVEILGRHKYKGAVDDLISYARSDEAASLKTTVSRYYPTHALGEIGEPRAIGPLVEIASGQKTDLGGWAISALGKIGRNKGLRTLRQLYKTKRKSHKYTLEMCRVVSAIFETGDLGLRNMIYDEFEKGDQLLIADILHALPSSGCEDALPHLSDYIEAKWEHADFAISLLPNVTGRACVPALYSLLDGSNYKLKRAAARAMMEFDDETKSAAVIALLKPATDKSERRAALLGITEVVNWLVLYTEHFSVPMMQKVIQWYEHGEVSEVPATSVDPEQQRAFIIKQLKGPTDYIREWALRWYRNLEYEPNDQIRTIALKDPDSRQRSLALEILAKHPSGENIEVLYLSVSKPTRLSNMHNVTKALARYDFGGFKSKLLDLLNHKNRTVRCDGLEACAYAMHDPEVRGKLYGMLDSEEDKIALGCVITAIKKDAEGVQYLLDLCRTQQQKATLTDREYRIKDKTLSGLSKVEHLPPEDTLLDLYVHEQDKDARYSLLYALGRNVTTRSGPQLLRFLQSLPLTKKNLDEIVLMLGVLKTATTRDQLLQNRINLQDYHEYPLCMRELHKSLKPQSYKAPQLPLAA